MNGAALFAAWRHRILLLRLIAASLALLLVAPVALVGLAVAALGGQLAPATDAAGADPPMPYWTVTQEFGCTGLAFEPAYAGCPHFHSGIDLAAAAGTPVSAVLAGTATVVTGGTGYGLHVLLEHPGGLVTLYGHLAAVAVVTGEVVQAGAVIGLEGSSGNSTGPHLHFEVRRDLSPMPPRQVFPGLFGPGQTRGPAEPAPKGRAN